MTEQEIVKALRCNKGCRYGSDIPIECRARYGGVPICPKESAVEEAPRVIERLSAEVERLQAQLSEEKTDATLYSDRLEEEQEYVRKLEAEASRLTRERDAAVKDCGVGIDACETCMHNADNSLCDCECDECMDKCPCNTCDNDNNNYAWRGLCAENGGVTDGV